MENLQPWEKPRIARIIELFDGNITEIKQITRSVGDGKENEICR